MLDPEPSERAGIVAAVKFRLAVLHARSCRVPPRRGSGQLAAINGVTGAIGVLGIVPGADGGEAGQD